MGRCSGALVCIPAHLGQLRSAQIWPSEAKGSHATSPKLALGSHNSPSIQGPLEGRQCHYGQCQQERVLPIPKRSDPTKEGWG